MTTSESRTGGIKASPQDCSRPLMKRAAAVAVVLLGLVTASVPTIEPAAASVPGFVRVAATSVSDSSDYKYITATCPNGKRLVGTGARTAAGLGKVVIDDISPRESPTGPPASVRVYAFETDPFEGDWKVTAFAICALPLAGLEWVKATSATDSYFEKTATAQCPAGKKLVGTGGNLVGGQGEVHMDFRPNGSVITAPTNVLVRGREAQSYAASWSVTAHAICANPIAGLVQVGDYSSTRDENVTFALSCPYGKVVLGTAANISVDVDSYDSLADFVLTGLVPSPYSVQFNARRENPGAGYWGVEGHAICASL
jgi:hypothetical protein